jgi:hypothetical protein
MRDIIKAFELRFGDGTHVCEFRDCPGKQPNGSDNGDPIYGINRR